MKLGILIYIAIGIWALIQLKKTGKRWYLLFIPIAGISFFGTTKTYLNLPFNAKLLTIIVVIILSVYTMRIILKDFKNEKIETRKKLRDGRKEKYLESEKNQSLETSFKSIKKVASYKDIPIVRKAIKSKK